MVNGHLILRAAVLAALSTASLSAAAATANTLAGINTAETPRVTQAVNANIVSAIAYTHPAVFSRAAPGAMVDASTMLNHLQLVLRPSVNRQTQLEALIQQQHDPSSPRFHQWLSPSQYGRTFGVLDSDISAVTAWLKSEGLRVNAVYPNMQVIDFSGTVGQINKALNIQERHFQLHGVDYVGSATNISVPAALAPVIMGVVGLHNFGIKPLVSSSRVGTSNPATHKFDLPQTPAAKALAMTGKPQAVSSDGVRGLVPDDFATMYDISSIRDNGVTGKGITIALVESVGTQAVSMSQASWQNFINQFNLGSYGGSFIEEQPQLVDSVSGDTINNCVKPYTLEFGADNDIESALDTEYAAAAAPGASIIDADCANVWIESPTSGLPTSNVYWGMYIAANDLINSETISIYGPQYSGPDIISASYGLSESETPAADKAEVDSLWAQADAEGVSVFVSSGDWGPDTAGAGLDPNSLATSPHVTAVGGTDLADTLDGTTSQYFSATPNASYGTALSYVPEIPWNESCGNGVVAKAAGFSSAPAYCGFLLSLDPDGYYVSWTASSGGPSSADIKPSWQKQVYGTASDRVRDVPDVALFAGSYNGSTATVVCTKNYPCAPDFSTPVNLIEGTSLSAPMMAGIQALMDQGLAMRGLPQDQGNAAPALYAIAAQEYGTRTGPHASSLNACSADNGTDGTGNCVFHDITRGTTSTECYQEIGSDILTPDCYFIGTVASGTVQIGLTAANGSQYGAQSKAYPAQPGWSFASGLGSVDARNLLIAWRAYAHAPAVSH